MGLTDNDLIYGDYNLSHDVWVEDVIIPVAPTLNVRTISVEGKDGVYTLPATVSPYVVLVYCRIRAESRDAAMLKRREVAAKLAAYREPVFLQHRHEALKHRAILNGETTPSWEINDLVFTLQFLCPDGVMYGATKTSAGLSHTISGTRSTPPIITVTGASASMNLLHTQSGKRLQLDGFAGTTQDIVIDCDKRTIKTADGLLNLREYLTLESRFFEFVPGQNNLTINAGTISVEYTERWA